VVVTAAASGTAIPAPWGLELSRSAVGRSAARRADDAWLATAWKDPATRVLIVESGRVHASFSDAGAELMFVPPAQAPDGVRFLLGVDSAQVAYFGVAGPLPDAAPGGTVRPAGLREAGPLLSDRVAGLLTHAVALANWHATAQYCPRCGAITQPEAAGHSRRCPVDDSEHFPRTDPAVIMIVTDPDDRCLLARNAQWPAGRVSVLAGFVEPGESAEQAVAREVHEETGVVVTAVHYAGSQPWPMPHNLMLGFRAQATSTELQVDGEEIAEARWYSRDELRDALLAGDLLIPPSVSISRWLIETWYGAELPGSWDRPSVAAGS
jgi:NAD+ diphosphatase